jgi:hypothetical protein
MATLADLRKRRTTDFDKLTKALENTNNQGSNNDEGFWKLERDKAGNGSAVIRFLPAYAGEDAGEADELPYVVMYSHSFQGPTGRWYIENCRSTLKQEDPVNDMNRLLWKGSDEDKKQASAQKRRTAYICQILVVSDPKNPDNNGKVFFYKFGKKIFDKIMDAARPTFEDEKPMNPFDLWEGANFKLRIKTVDGFPNYDASVFDSPSPIAEDDEDILKIVNQQKSLQRFLDPSNFKSYEELEKKLKSVLSKDQPSTKKAEDIAKEMRGEKTTEAGEKVKEIVKSEEPKTTADVGSGDDDIDDFFKSIIED